MALVQLPIFRRRSFLKGGVVKTFLWADNRMQKSQYSLRRLLCNVAAICVVLGCAIKYPIPTAILTTKLLLFAPALTVTLIACWLSKNRKRTALVVLTGAIIGWLLSPTIFVSWSRPPTFLDHFLIDFNTVGVFSGVGALVFAMLEWIIATISRRPTWFFR